MDYFGINSADELPKIKEIGELAIEPTAIQNTLFGQEKTDEQEPDSELSVTEEGELIINKDKDEEES